MPRDQYIAEERKDRSNQPKQPAKCVNEDPPKHAPYRYKNILYSYLLHGFPPSVQSTVLSRVDINVKENEIQVDFDRLGRFILNERKSASMSKKLERHIEAIVGLEDWTDFHATKSVTSKKAVIVSFK